MFTKAELLDAINDLEGGRHSIQNCEKLAAIYTVLDHLYPEECNDKSNYFSNYSGALEPVSIESKIPGYGETDFLQAIKGKDAEGMWLLMDELMTTLAVINPRLYDGVMRKI